MDLTGFMFGNVNEEGELENEELIDRDAVAQLSRLGVCSDGLGGLGEDHDDGDQAGPSSAGMPTAQDFSEIDEMAVDESPTVQPAASVTDFYPKGYGFAPLPAPNKDDDYDDYDSADQDTTTHTGSLPTSLDLGYVSQSASSSLEMSEPDHLDIAEGTSGQLITDNTTLTSDSDPSENNLRTSTESSGPTQEPMEVQTDNDKQDGVYSDSAIPALIPDNMSIEQLHAKVKELFPGFKPHGILRFSSLLGLGKRSSLPQVWNGAMKPKKRSGKRTGELKLDIDFVPPPEMVMESDEVSFLSTTPTSAQTTASSSGRRGQKTAVDPQIKEWRNGPAKIWYDMLSLPEDGFGLDYGFKLKSSQVSEDEGNEDSVGEDLPDDAFLMITQHAWENDVQWDVPYTPGPPMTGAGGVWKPVSESSSSRHLSSDPPASTMTASMFPIDNYELVYGKWEDNVIWDSEAVATIPPPSLPRIDPNDPNFILGLPEEPEPPPSADKDLKKEGKKGMRSARGGQGPDSTPNLMGLKKDMFNLSNDEYYNPRHIASSSLLGFESTVVQHSSPALDLHLPWFPPHPSSSSLRHFHRPQLRIRCPSKETTTGFYTISDLHKHMAKKAKERDKERIASGGGEVFFMREPGDLTVCDGGLILAECSEQYPPLVNTIGMATKIKNYYRRNERQVKSQAPNFKFGETAYVQNSSYFLGQLGHGQTLQSFENNMYRAPLYSHTPPPTDFLLSVAGDKVFIREIEALFLQGQQCPKIEVPAPNSKSSTAFQKDLLQVHLYRLFRESEDVPKRIKMDTVRKFFPASIMSESVIRKVLKTCADFKREGYETGGWWVLRGDFRLPVEEELRSQITPEQMCAYYGMLSSEARLHEAGYRGRSLFVIEEEEEESNTKIDDELRCAPWNTTHHFINASKGKYQLSVSGPADPTGCGEGFSYTRLNPRRDGSGSSQASKKYKSVMGTDSDLRKLKLSKAKTLLRNFGVPEEEISKMSRWQVVDRVRELSTKAVKSGAEGMDLKNLKFARGARFSQMEAQEKYKEECQRIFDLQNEVLKSEDVLSTDEESSGGESDDELGRDLETLLRGSKTTSQLTREQEEAERLELKKLIMGTDKKDNDRGTPIVADQDETSSVMSFSSGTGRRLVISRTFRDEDGKEFVRDEVVKRADVIDAYVRLSKDMRSKFIDQDEQTREELRKDKKKIQDELRRLNNPKKKPKKPQKPKPLTTINMKCSACGQRGHMKTNRSCPAFTSRGANVALTDQELEQHEAELSSQTDIVKVEGTKVILNRSVVEKVSELRRRSLLLKVDKDAIKKRRKGPQDEDLDYLETRKSVQRRKTNPEVPFSDHLEKILQTLINLPESYHFRKPVQQKIVPDYYNVIKFPMDLHTMRDHCRHHVYKSREAFKEHINLIVTNCVTYNGSTSEVTQHARKMASLCDQELIAIEKELEQLEAEINPVLDDNAVVALCYLLGKSVEVMKAVDQTWPFHHPVSAKKIPDYHKIIKSPMDLQTMKKNCTGRVYTAVDQFVMDLDQIVENSITYNGPSSTFTQTAEKMREAGLKFLEENVEMISQLGDRIQESEVQSAAAGPSGSKGRGEDDMLFQDLQHSSSESESQSDMEETL